MHVHRRNFNAFVISAGMGVFAPAQAMGLADLSSGEASQGLKKALEKGAATAIGMLGVENGFFNHQKLRIGFPESLNKGADLLKKMGMRRQVDELVLQMNRAAEKAIPLSEKWLTQAIQSMSVQDAKSILKGGDTSVTQFFADKTRNPLTTEFTPQVKQVLGELGVVEQFNAIGGKLAGMGLMPKDKALLENHVTGKALDGLYFMIGEEERKIRQNPMQAGSDLLAKVFGTLK